MASDTGQKFDNNFLKESARRCRMPPDVPTEHELTFFPELWDCKTTVEIFVMVRNTALATWLRNEKRECTTADVHQSLNPPFNSDLDFIQNIVQYLTRHGIINFGRYTRVIKVTKVMNREDRNVVVIGAGAAGISAATQLKSFGFNVIILEAKNRIGGRAANIVTENGEIMETGADMLRGLEDSPMATLLHQTQMEQHSTLNNAVVFLDGKKVDCKKEKLISAVYANAKGALDWQCHQKEQRDEQGHFTSRKQAYENVANLVERHSQIEYFNYCKSLEEVARHREHHYNQMKQLREMSIIAEKRLSEMKEDEDRLLRRSLKRDIVTAMEKFEEASQAFEVADGHFIRLKTQPARKNYMNPADFKNLNIFLGFEEYFYGAPLEKIQFSCNTSKIEKSEVVPRLPNGIFELLVAVAERRELDIRIKHRVRDIDYSSSDYVKLTVENNNEKVVEMKAAFVVSTLPIGVMKKIIVNDPRAPTFTPPLPEVIVEAIKNMGNGLINKCILLFEEAFWPSTGGHQFVTVSPDIQTRGAYMLWSSVPGSKVLTTYLIGTAAVQSYSNQIIIETAMSALTKVFGDQCPKTPLEAHVTRWQDDEFAFGSGSYMGLTTEMHHFDELIKPLKSPCERDSEAGPSKPRVYFAGEHTCQKYIATMQGAWISGARVAAEIANEVKGVGFVSLHMEEVNEDDDGPM